MSLEPGTRLGPYEVVAPLGAGGMGEVYRAHDTRLKRDVAIKVLPASFTQDADRVTRFQREAELLATLNHPNIAGIYGLEESPSTGSGQAATIAIVLELVEGDTLADRIARGPLAIDEAVGIARQLIDALEAAHEKGVIHRDLKPANVKVTPDGKVKVLDFGLAKMLEGADVARGFSPATQSMSPTLSVHATHAGVILGTAAYMSPEQARGKRVDRRTDIWAFGCLLFEMLAGKSAFAGEEISDTLAFVITKEPDWSALPAATPAPILKLLRRCLEKDRNRRLADIADARFELDEALTTPAPAVAVVPVASKRRSTMLAIAAAVLGLATIALAAVVVSLLRSAETPAVVRFAIPPPDKTAFDFAYIGINGGTVSPDGRRLLFTARDAAGKVQLWVRPIDSLVAQPLAGTENTTGAYWSPDSRFIGFVADGKLKKTDLSGAPPVTLCNAPAPRGGTWGRDGIIVFAPNNIGPLFRVSAAGGEPAPVTRLQTGQRSHRLPSFLPDGRHFVFFAAATGTPGIFLGSLDSEETKRLQAADSNAIYAPPGYLLFVRQGTLLAQAFDARKLELAGEPFPIAERVASDPANGVAAFSVSDNGVLTYRQGTAIGEGMQLAWFDRQGKQIESIGEPDPYRGVDVSPDGLRVAAHRHEGLGGDIWLLERTRGTTSRFTFDASQDNSSPVWSPDGSQIAFGSLRGGSWGLYQKASNRAANEERLFQTDKVVMPMGWSPDGRSIVYVVLDPKTGNDLWVLPLSGDRKPVPFAQSPFTESFGQISPDGRWMAYESTETGRGEVYVRSFPSGPAKWQISTSGGNWPRWRHDGKELFYMSLDARRTLLAVDVKTNGPTFDASVPKALFDTRFVNVNHVGAYHPYAVSPDGQRFLISRRAGAEGDEAPPSPITVVLNWTAALRK